MPKTALYSTYARIYIGLSPYLVDLVKKYSRHSPATQQSAVLPITVLPENQVKQALSHPQTNSLRTLIGTAYKDRIAMENLICASQADVEEQRVFIKSTLEELQDKKKSKSISDASKARIDEATDVLYKQLVTMQSIQADIDDGEKKSKSLQDAMMVLSKKQDIEWDKYREKNLSELHEKIDAVLRDAGLPPLNPGVGGDVANLMRQDLQDLLDRFTDLAKDLPPEELEKIIRLQHPDVATYFKMKAYLAIRSVNPHPKQYAELMKKLEPFFDEAKKEGQALMSKHDQEIALIDDETKPMLDKLKARKQQLTQLQEDRDILLQHTTTEDIQKAILERVQRIEELPKPG